jgi:hypothetical protein
LLALPAHFHERVTTLESRTLHQPEKPTPRLGTLACLYLGFPFSSTSALLSTLACLPCITLRSITTAGSTFLACIFETIPKFSSARSVSNSRPRLAFYGRCGVRSTLETRCKFPSRNSTSVFRPPLPVRISQSLRLIARSLIPSAEACLCAPSEIGHPQRSVLSLAGQCRRSNLTPRHPKIPVPRAYCRVVTATLPIPQLSRSLRAQVTEKTRIVVPQSKSTFILFLIPAFLDTQGNFLQ